MDRGRDQCGLRGRRRYRFMGAPRARAGPDLIATDARPVGSAAAVLDFAVAQILRDDTELGGLRAALAFQPPVQLAPGQPPAVLAMHPPGAVDQALLARIGALTLAQRNTTLGDTAASPLLVTMGGQPASALLAHSVPAGG